MANEFFTILTATGRNKLAAATATATPLALTQMAVGDGDNGAYYSPTEAQTALKHEVWRGAINHLAVDANNPNWIVAELVIPDDVGGFYIREVGLFDSAGAMIAVGKFPESYKPTLAAGSNKQLYVRMILEVSNTTAVTLLVDPSVVLATRQYCDDKVASEINKLDGKQSVRVATTAAIVLTGLQTIDGVVLAAGDRVLVKDQATTKDNGIFVVAAGAWARASDADVAAEVTPGMLISVEQGTASADTVWMLVTDGPITLGTTGLSFDLIGKRGLVTNAEMALALADKVSKPELQSQAYTAFTTAGGAPNYTLAPTPAITVYAPGQRFRVKVHAAGSGADVLNVSGLGNKTLKQYSSSGGKVAAVIAANQLADVEYDGVDMVIINPLPVPVEGLVQPGTVIYIAKNTPPTGYLKANGAAVSRATYAALFSAIGTTFGVGDGATTFNLPDLRGEFIRGWDDSRGVDSGRVFGSAQTDDLKSHAHQWNQYAMNSLDTTGGPQIVGADSGGSSLGWSSGAISNTGGTETRPRNIALLACIKY